MASAEDRWSDKELVAACNSGSATEAQRAFAALYNRHKDFVVRVAFRYGADSDTALDVLQDTFSYLLSKFPPRGPGLTLTASLTTLLYPAAKNNAISILRNSRRFPTSDAVDPDDLQMTTTPLRPDIQPLIRDLPPDRQEVILLRFVDDMSLQEIAEALEVPLGTVKSRLHLAIKQLRESPDTRKFFDS